MQFRVHRPAQLRTIGLPRGGGLTVWGIPSYAGWSLWVGILVGIAAAVLLALLLGIPTLRLRADYLAIVTIAAAEILRLTFRSVTFDPVFGGSDGINRFADDFYTYNPYSGPVKIGPAEFSQNDMWIVTIGWILVIPSILVFLLMRSPGARHQRPSGRTRTRVRSLGKSVYSVQSCRSR